MWGFVLVCFLLATVAQATAHALRVQPAVNARAQPAATIPMQPLRVHFRKATGGDLAAVAALRCRVFSPYLTSMGSQYLQQQQYVEAMRTKSAVLVAAEIAYGGDDATACAAIGQASSPAAAPAAVAVGSTIDQWHDRGAGDKKPIAAGATVHAELIVGSADLVFSHNCAYVTNVCVASRARRQGIGRELMRLAGEVSLEQFKATDLLLHVESDNDAARRLYESLGFDALEACEDASSLSAAEAFFTGKYVDPKLPPQQMMRKALCPQGE